MGRQWLQKKRLIKGLAKGKTNNKLVRDIALAARNGADPTMNARLFTTVETAGSNRWVRQPVLQSI